MAGADTVASALCGAIFLLATHPQCLAEAASEVRSAFASPRDMDIKNTKTLSYLQAVVNEALRMYPPVPGALLRVSPPGGTFLLGQFVTGGVSNLLGCTLPKPILINRRGDNYQTLTDRCHRRF